MVDIEEANVGQPIAILNGEPVANIELNYFTKDYSDFRIGLDGVSPKEAALRLRASADIIEEQIINQVKSESRKNALQKAQEVSTRM